MVKSKPLGEEVLSLFLTYRLSRHKANTFLKLFFCLHTTHREETQSEDSTCLHTALGHRSSSPCPVPASCKVTIAMHCTAGDARGTGLTLVPWGSLGMQVALWCPATFRVFKKENIPRTGTVLHSALGTFLTFFLTFLLFTIIYFHFSFFPSCSQAKTNDAEVMPARSLHIQKVPPNLETPKSLPGTVAWYFLTVSVVEKSYYSTLEHLEPTKKPFMWTF